MAPWATERESTPQESRPWATDRESTHKDSRNEAILFHYTGIADDVDVHNDDNIDVYVYGEVNVNIDVYVDVVGPD